MSDTANILNLNHRVALVTGAGQGVGASTAHYLAAQGARLVVNDYYQDRAEAVASEIVAAGGKAIAIQADVTDFASVLAMVAQARETIGVINVLVNNAGNAGISNDRSGASHVSFWERDPTEWEPYLRVNLYGPMHCARAVLPAMVEAADTGRIITIISDAGRVGEPGSEAYSAAKAGAAGLTRALARSLGRYEITANCIAIAATRTPATEARMQDEAFMKKVLSNYIIRRPGEPSDVAAMVTFLASDAAGWTTGQTYPVNGGYSVNL